MLGQHSRQRWEWLGLSENRREELFDLFRRDFSFFGEVGEHLVDLVIRHRKLKVIISFGRSIGKVQVSDELPEVYVAIGILIDIVEHRLGFFLCDRSVQSPHLPPELFEGNEVVAISVEEFKDVLEFFVGRRVFSLFFYGVDDVSELIEVDVSVLVDIAVLENAVGCILLVPEEATLLKILPQFLGKVIGTEREMNPLLSESIFLKSFLRAEFCLR